VRERKRSERERALKPEEKRREGKERERE